MTNDSSRSRTILHLLTEVGLVSLGVFLALVAGQWRDAGEHRAQANATLRYFREDILANERAITKERAYHQALAEEVALFLKSPPPRTIQGYEQAVHFRGCTRSPWSARRGNWPWPTRPYRTFLHIWRTPSPAFYTRQDAFQTLENGFLQSAFTPSTSGNGDPTGFVTAMLLYLTDVNLQEPSLLEAYGTLLTEIDAVVPPKP